MRWVNSLALMPFNIPVQPSWRDRAEMMGYLNEFTKRFNESDFLAALYETNLP